MEAMAYHFPKDLYDVAEAKAWLKKNEVKCIRFEPAGKSEETAQQKHCAMVTNASRVHTFDNSILQMLNRWIPDKERGHYFAVEPFANSIEAGKWNGTKLVYAQTHPDLELFATDPEKALSQVLTRKGEPGRVVGTLSDPSIITEGHPRFMGKLPIADKEVKQLWDEGLLSLSTAFFCTLNDDRHVVGDIEPNHILLFEENDIRQPADKGALVNQDGTGGECVTGTAQAQTSIDKLEAALSAFKTSIMGLFPKEQAPGKPEVSNVENPPAPAAKKQETTQMGDLMDDKEREALKNQVDAAQKETTDLKAQIANLETESKKKDTELVALRQTVAAVEKAKQDAAFVAFTKTIKPALIHTEDDKRKIRERFDNDPQGLLAEIANMLPDAKAETQEQGSKAGALNQQAAGAPTVGTLDPKTGKYPGAV